MEEVVTQSHLCQDYVLGPLVVETDVLFEVIDVPSDRRDSLGSRLMSLPHQNRTARRAGSGG